MQTGLVVSSCRQGSITLLHLSAESVHCRSRGHSAAGVLGSVCGSTAANWQLLLLCVPLGEEVFGQTVGVVAGEVSPKAHGQHSKWGQVNVIARVSRTSWFALPASVLI